MFKTTPSRIYDLLFEVDREAFQNLFHRGLKTQHRLNFTLEELRCTPELTVEITPLFEVTFGHFGFKIRRIDTRGEPASELDLGATWKTD